MITRLRSRRRFEELRANGIRIRRGPLSMTYLDDAPHGECRLGFAIPRRTGTAVVRNRIRRRLRSIFDELAGHGTPVLPSGSLLVSAGPAAADLSHVELRDHVRQMLTDLGSARNRSA